MCQLNIYEGLLLYLAVSQSFIVLFYEIVFPAHWAPSAHGSYVIVKF